MTVSADKKNRLPAQGNDRSNKIEVDQETKDPKKKPEKQRELVISPPKFETAFFTIVGLTAYVQNRFSNKTCAKIRRKQELGSTTRKGEKREPKNFQALYEESQHRDRDQGWIGMPATAFRSAMVSACKLTGYAMTMAKLTIFIEADGYDEEETPLIKIIGKPEQFEVPVRQQGSMDLRVRTKFRAGWKATLRVRYDADQFRLEDVANLLLRVGMQVGIGEGRPDSRKSAGQGWGLFGLESSSLA